MFDVALTDTGDIMFVQDMSKTNPLKISFLATQAKGVKLNFEIENCVPRICSNNGMMISFDIKQLKYNKKAMLLSDDGALIQIIRMRLMTALGELTERKDIGSRIELVRHQPLHEQKTKLLAQTVVKEAIANILPEAVVTAEPVVKSKNEYWQGLRISIYVDGELLTDYSI